TPRLWAPTSARPPAPNPETPGGLRSPRTGGPSRTGPASGPGSACRAPPPQAAPGGGPRREAHQRAGASRRGLPDRVGQRVDALHRAVLRTGGPAELDRERVTVRAGVDEFHE